MREKSRWWLLTVALSAGCADVPPPAGDPLVQFLRDGRTTRREVTAHLGEPAGTLERGRILTYRVGYDGSDKCYRTIPREESASGWPKWINAGYSLVLVFDGSVLRQHELVKVK